MFINAKTRIKFLANQVSKDIDMTPQVLSVLEEKDHDGNTRKVLVLKFFCRVNQRLLNKSVCSKIDVKLSNLGLTYFKAKSSLTQTKVMTASVGKERGAIENVDNSELQSALSFNTQDQRKARKEKRRRSRNQKSKGDNSKKNKRLRRTNPVRQSLNSKVALEPKNLAVTAQNGSKFKLIKNQSLYNGVKNIASISVNTSPSFLGKTFKERKTSRALNQKPELILSIEKKNYSDASQHDSIYKSNPISFRRFKRSYNRLVNTSIDPLSLFEKEINKASYQQQRKGISNKPTISRFATKQASEVIEEIQRRISIVSKSRYEFKKVQSQSKFKILECTGRISLKDLKLMGSTGNIIFIAKDRNGINLESQDIVFNVNEILKQTIKQSTEAFCNVTRKPSGVTKLVISNLTPQSLLDVNVNVKKITRQVNFLETFYDNIVGDRKIPANSTLSIIDGAIDSNPKTPVNFNASESLFFRTTLNYRGKAYQNAHSASIKGVRGSKKNDNIPNLNIIAKLDEFSRGINVAITNISDNVVAVKLKKYRYTSSAKGMLLETHDLDRNINKFVFLSQETGSKKARSLKLFDTDVFENKVYMYVVECIMKNGEKKLATDYFIEKYEERNEILKIDNITIDAENLILDASASLNEERKATRTVSINFKISKIKTEVDKIIKNLFGNLFEVYKEELQKIKDVQGLVYSIEVQRIEELTGNTITVDKITADKDGQCNFTDTTAPVFSNLIYKLIPRVRPANEVIAAVVAQTPNLAKRTLNSPINFVSAAARVNAKNRNSGVYTSKKNKYNDRQVFKRGRIRTPKDILNQNANDLFADASTGDITYVEVGGLSSSRVYDEINFTKGTVSEIKHTHSLADSNSSLVNNMITKFYEMEFNSNNDYLVDFYAVFIKEGTHVYLDGATHSTDTLVADKRYAYLIKHTGSVGVIEYYVVPILKNGKILDPKLVTAQLIK